MDNFKDSKKNVDEFKKTLVSPHGDDNPDSWFFAILYAIRFQLTRKTNACENEDKLKNDINKVGLSELFLTRNKLKLDFDILNFKQRCHQVNQILNKCNFFLKVYEKRNFDCLLKQNPDKKSIIRELSGCIANKYNWFNIVQLEHSKKILQKFILIEIIYKPVENYNEVINCYFSSKINLAFGSTFSENRILRMCNFSMSLLLKILWTKREIWSSSW